ncbi:MAG: hypothetical protein ACXWUH_10735, partial [Burkholderiales bacterium]
MRSVSTSGARRRIAAPARFRLFIYHGGRDLTRFEDGTENPKGHDAVEAAIVQDGPSGG